MTVELNNFPNLCSGIFSKCILVKMSHNKRSHGSNCKRQKITLKLKREIIDKREQGVSVTDLARIYNKPTSTICTILKNKEKIKEVDASKGVTRISAQRLRILDDVERLLLTWINEKQVQGDTIDQGTICEKAKLIFADLIKRTPASLTTGDEVFKASRGWFEKFKRRTGIYSVSRHSEAASCDIRTGKHFMADFKNHDSEDYVPQKVFNSNETNIFSKKMSKRTYITADLFEHKTMNEANVDEHNQQITNGEFMELNCAQENVEESLPGDEEKMPEKQQSGKLKKILKAWETIASYIEKHHPNKEAAVRAINTFNDSAMSHFYQIWKRRQKKMVLNGCLIKKK